MDHIVKMSHQFVTRRARQWRFQLQRRMQITKSDINTCFNFGFAIGLACEMVTFYKYNLTCRTDLFKTQMKSIFGFTMWGSVLGLVCKRTIAKSILLVMAHDRVYYYHPSDKIEIRSD